MTNKSERYSFTARELLVNLGGLMVVYMTLGILLVFLGVLTPGKAHGDTLDDFRYLKDELLPAVGVTFIYDANKDLEVCQEGNYGFFKATSETTGIFMVCHHKDKMELQDTVRHEAVHVAQWCRFRSDGGYTLELDIPYQWSKMVQDHPSYADKESVVHSLEAEAFYMAHRFSLVHIMSYITEHCGVFTQ